MDTRHPPATEPPIESGEWDTVQLLDTALFLCRHSPLLRMVRSAPLTLFAIVPMCAEGENSIPSKKQETICVQVILKWVRERSMGYRTRGKAEAQPSTRPNHPRPPTAQH